MASPPFPVLMGFIKRIWSEFVIDKIVMLRNGVILVRFNSIDTRDKVLVQGVYQFDKKRLIVKSWHKDFQKEKINQVPVLVRLPDLDLKYWGVSAWSKLASLLGTPIMADQNTQEKSKANYARVLIEV